MDALLAGAPSMVVFRAFISRDPHGAVDASLIHSRACYELWLSTRSEPLRDPEHKFRRTLTATLSGTDGRVPFTPEEEVAVAQVLRVKQVWYVARPPPALQASA